MGKKNKNKDAGDTGTDFVDGFDADETDDGTEEVEATTASTDEKDPADNPTGNLAGDNSTRGEGKVGDAEAFGAEPLIPETPEANEQKAEEPADADLGKPEEEKASHLGQYVSANPQPEEEGVYGVPETNSNRSGSYHVSHVIEILPALDRFKVEAEEPKENPPQEVPPVKEKVDPNSLKYTNPEADVPEEFHLPVKEVAPVNAPSEPDAAKNKDNEIDPAPASKPDSAPATLKDPDEGPGDNNSKFGVFEPAFEANTVSEAK